MKGIMKKIISITLILQIVIASLAFTPSSYASNITINTDNTLTQTEGENATITQEPVDNTEATEADPFSKFLDGLAGILVLPVKIIPLVVGQVLTWIMNAVIGEGAGQLTVEDILFNEIHLTDINFFQLNSGDATVDQIRKSVSIWYYSIRNLAAILLVVIIVYVGIRMALSTIAEDKAKYKQMLIDWITGLALLFVLHYLMVAIVNVNNILVDVLSGARSVTGSADLPFVDISIVKMKLESTQNALFLNAFSFGFTKGLGSALCYVLLVGVTFLFLLSYVKRMITIAFLIVIAPLVTVTYSIDKMGDSKSQALNTWLKEFSYSILIQPFQCVTYLALGQTAIATLDEGYSIKAVVIAISMLIFILTSEKIIKHIFHFENQSMTDTLAAAVGGATLMSLASKAGGSRGGKGGGSGDSSNKFADPQKSMTTPKKGATNVRQGGNPNRAPSGGSGGGTGTGVGAGAGTGSSGTPSGGGSGSGAGTPPSGGSRRAKGSGALGTVGAVAGAWLIKVGAYATGAMLGLGATGSIKDGALQGGALAGGFVSKHMKQSETNGKRRNLARAYNNYANTLAQQNPNLTAEQINTQVRKKAVDMLQGNTQGTLTPDEEVLQAALKDMNSNYAKNGMSEEERNEALNKDFNGIETGTISETSAPIRFVGNIKRTASRVANRRGRWGYNGGRGSNPSGGSST